MHSPAPTADGIIAGDTVGQSQDWLACCDPITEVTQLIKILVDAAEPTSIYHSGEGIVLDCGTFHSDGVGNLPLHPWQRRKYSAIGDCKATK